MSTPQDPNVEPIVAPKTTKEFQKKGTFVGKRYLVVGGTKGIGRGIAFALAECDASVTIVGRSAADDIVGGLRAISPDSEFEAIQADLSTRAGVKTFVSGLQGKFDGLIMTLGVWPDSTQPRSPEGYDRVVFIDIIARFLIFTGMADEGILREGGLVVNVLGSGQKPSPIMDATKLPDVFDVRPETYTASMSSLPESGAVSDIWLSEASKHYPNFRFIGTMPGFIRTKITDATFGSTFTRVFFNVGDLLRVTSTPLECGVRHLNVMAEQQTPFGLWDHYLIPRQRAFSDPTLTTAVWNNLQSLK